MGDFEDCFGAGAESDSDSVIDGISEDNPLLVNHGEGVEIKTGRRIPPQYRKPNTGSPSSVVVLCYP